MHWSVVCQHCLRQPPTQRLYAAFDINMIIVQRWQRSCCSSGRKSDKAVAFQWITTTIILQQRVYSLTKWWPCFRKLPRHCFHMQCMPLPRIAKDCPGLPRIAQDWVLDSKTSVFIFLHDCNAIWRDYHQRVRGRLDEKQCNQTFSPGAKHSALVHSLKALKSGRAIMQKKSQTGKDKAAKCMSLSFSKLYSSNINIQFKMNW